MPKKLPLDKENEFEERKNNAKKLIASINSESDILEKRLGPSPCKNEEIYPKILFKSYEGIKLL